ncbi:MAG: hypothetical protein AAFR93_07795 [Pseudomonadota bacterium]
MKSASKAEGRSKTKPVQAPAPHFGAIANQLAQKGVADGIVAFAKGLALGDASPQGLVTPRFWANPGSALAGLPRGLDRPTAAVNGGFG